MTENKKHDVLLLRRSRGKLHGVVEPIVIEYKERKKKRKRVADDDGRERYSRGLKDIQRFESDAVKIARKSAKALSKGLDTYEQESSRSAKEKKDGAIEDFVHNSAKAASAFIKETSDIPVDIADSMYTKSYRTRLRRNLRRASKIIRLFRI